MSKNSNRIKDELLGMPHGTANGKLRKLLIYKLADLAGLLTCFRCNHKIESPLTLSIEHKLSWQSAENPKEMFFNLDNIAFSHLQCNCSAGKRHKKYHTETEFRASRVLATSRWREQLGEYARKEKRREQYLRHGW